MLLALAFASVLFISHMPGIPNSIDQPIQFQYHSVIFSIQRFHRIIYFNSFYDLI